jgi:hypothetical protein
MSCGSPQVARFFVWLFALNLENGSCYKIFIIKENIILEDNELINLCQNYRPSLSLQNRHVDNARNRLLDVLRYEQQAVTAAILLPAQYQLAIQKTEPGDP